jgi:tripartite-type tricarboxylate transporter receptor subunit TctC
VVAPATYSNPGYDVARDLAGVTALVSLPNVLVVAPNKYKTLKDLVDAAKAKPGAMNYASAGVGSAAHLNGERFRLATGIDVQHVPYKGGPEGLTAVMTGDCGSIIRAGRARWSRPASSRCSRHGSARASALPDVPTPWAAATPSTFWSACSRRRDASDRRQAHAETLKARPIRP